MNRPNFRNLALDAATIAIAICAITATALLIRNWPFSSRSVAPPQVSRAEERTVQDWQTYADSGNRMGASNAIVTIVEFGDYQCPACRVLAPVLRAALAKYPDDVALVYRHLPMPYHYAAYPAARAAECAAAQDRFLEFHDLLYSRGEWILEPTATFLKFADAIALPDKSTFAACMSSIEPHPNVESDMNKAEELGARGTPTIMVNGLILGAVPDSTRLDNVIRAAAGW